MPSRTSGEAARCSRATKAARIAATAANETSVRADPQPTVGASTTVKTSSSIAAVRLTAPTRSKATPVPRRRASPDGAGDQLRRTRAAAASTGTSRVAATRVISATGTGRKNTQRQPISVSRPPKTSPREKPVAPVAV